MAGNNGSKLIGVESLHYGLTGIFLRENQDGRVCEDKHPHPPIVGLSGNITARDVTHSFHSEYFSPRFNSAFYGEWAPGSSNSPNTYEERRQKRIYFLQAHQAFFELRFEDSLTFLLGKPSFHGPDSLAGNSLAMQHVLGVEATESTIIFAPETTMPEQQVRSSFEQALSSVDRNL